MNRSISSRANRWLAGLISLSLLVSILTSSTQLLLRAVDAQKTATLHVGEKLGQNLPELSPIRNKTVSQPKAPDFGASSSRCFDCKESSPLEDVFSEARLEPTNRTGEAGVDLLSRNIHWAEPLINLKGRAGLDLSLSLAYNSLVWTKAGSEVVLDADRGQPSPGFRLGFPTIQPRFYNTESRKNAYLLITPEGKRVELRQVENSNEYESIDNSLLQMIDNGQNGAILLRPDGSRLNFKWTGGQLQCVEVKDRNGNYMTADYDKRGHIKTITDTVGRTLIFVRDNGGNLNAIREKSDSNNRVIATFGYSDLQVATTFSGLKVVRAANGSTIPVLTQVGVSDGSHYQFDYTSGAQIAKITKYAPDGHALNYVSYDLPQNAVNESGSPLTPTESREWAERANNQVEAVTRYSFDPNGSWGQVALPDGSIHKEIFGTAGWMKGLTTETEDSIGGTLQRRAVVSWTQDNEALSYVSNPRRQDVHTYYALGNKQSTRTQYGSDGLVSDVYRYSDNENVPIVHTHMEYESDSVYTGRHILGLVKEQTNYAADGSLISKTSYDYDINPVENSGAVIQHDDVNFGSSLQKGRGLLSAVRSWKGQAGQTVTTYTAYNTTGSVVVKRDGTGRETRFDYTDNFSDVKNRRSFAFATTRSDSKGFRLSTQYDFETGARSRTQDEHGTTKVFTYDAAGRAIASTNQTTGGSARRIYDDNGATVATFAKMRANFRELGSYSIYDGAARLIGRAKDPLTKDGGYKGVYIERDVMGRPVSETKPVRMSSAWDLKEEPISLNSTDKSSKQPKNRSLISSVQSFGKELLDGLDQVVGAVEPTASAQGNCVPGYYCNDDGVGTWDTGADGYDHYVGDYDGAYSADLGATWNASGQYWDFGGDQTPIQVSDGTDSSVGDQLLIAGGIVLVFGGPEDPVGDLAAGGYLTYEWLVVGTAVVAAGSSAGIVQTAYPPVPWGNPSQSPGAGWEWRGPGAPGSEQGAWHNPGTGESLHPDLNHPGPIGPHWDYVDPNGQGWRAYPDGRLEPK
jgi:YD repeat-containing protein